MKKYPFSKKAVQAMLAATIAFSPVVSYGVVGSPVQVEAATIPNFPTVDALVDYLDGVYDDLEDNDKYYLRQASNNLKGISGDDWAEYVSDMLGKSGNEKLSKEDPEVKLFSGLITLFSSTTTGELKENVTKFRNENSRTVDTVLGNDVTVEKLLAFFKSVAEYVLDDNKVKDLEKESDYYKLVFEGLTKVQGHEDVKAGINRVRLDEFGTLAALIKITERVDSSSCGQDVFIKSIQLAAGVSRDAVKDTSACKIPPGGNQGPGTGGGGTPAPTPEQGEVNLPEGSVVDGKIPADKVQGIIDAVTAEQGIIPVKLDGAVTNAEVPATLFSEVVKKNANAVVEVKTDAASYKLPASQIDVAALATKLGVAAADVQITVSVKVVDVTPTKGTLASKVVEFKIEAVSGDKKEAVTTFSVYVERDIVGDANFKPENQVAVVLDDNGDVLNSVPTVFDGKTATIKSLTNSKYAIVENDVTFPDVKSGWAKEYIETLASKYIVEGHNTGKFAPKETTTRAQFAVLLVRALGLPGETYDKSFTDVKGTEWYNENGELAAAVKYGIIEGKGNNKFDPNGEVTRAEAAAMIARAIELDFLNFDKSQFDSKKQLSTFKDASNVPAWAKEEMTAVLQAGIIGGHADNTIDAKGSTTREQIAKIVAEFLVKSKLMNDTFNN